MKKIIPNWIGILLAISIFQSAFSQTDSFDIVRYTPPKDWSRQVNNGVLIYTHLDSASGAFCVLAIYPSTPTLGDAKKDFRRDWKLRAIDTYQASENPELVEQSTPDGWKAITGGAPIILDSVNAIIISTTFSGYGKTANILATLNNQSYLPGIDSFLAHLRLDTTAYAMKNDVAQTTSAKYNTSPVDIIGTWSSYSAAIGNYVTSSGVFVGSADVHTAEEYEFKSNGEYIQKFFGSVYGRMYYTETKGTYKVAGENLTLSPISRRGGYSGVIKDEKNLMGGPETLQFYIGPNKWQPGPFLNLHKDGKYYMWEDYPYNYYQKIDPAAAKQK